MRWLRRIGDLDEDDEEEEDNGGQGSDENNGTDSDGGHGNKGISANEHDNGKTTPVGDGENGSFADDGNPCDDDDGDRNGLKDDKDRERPFPQSRPDEDKSNEHRDFEEGCNYNGDDGMDLAAGKDAQRLDHEAERRLMEEQMQLDPQCNNNQSRSLVMVDIRDVQVDSNCDGYTFYFTSVADGPVMNKMTHQQIMCLLTVIHSFIPRECILETEHLKPVFQNDGLHTLYRKVVLTEEELEQERHNRENSKGQLLCDMPFDVLFSLAEGDSDGSGRDDGRVSDDENMMMDTEDDVANHQSKGSVTEGLMSAFERARKDLAMAGPNMSPIRRARKEPTMAGPDKKKWHVTDVADILLAPICVSYMDGDAVCEEEEITHQQQQQQQGDGKKTASYWAVIFKTRACYNFVGHLQWLVNQVDREDKTNMKKSVNRDFEEVMDMWRDIILYQYEQSPSAIAYFRSMGPMVRIDPLRRLDTKCTPDSLDQACSPFEAYRSIVFHVLKEDSRRKILHVSGFSDTMLFTAGMLRKSLARQRRFVLSDPSMFSICHSTIR